MWKEDDGPQSLKILGQRLCFFWGAGELGLSVMMWLPNFVDLKVVVRKF